MLAPDKGGSGLGLTELCLLAEELGTSLAALPLPAAIGGILAIAECEQALPTDLLAGAIAGKALVDRHLRAPPSGEDEPLALTGVRRTNQRLRGLRVAVPCAFVAAGFVVQARIGADLAP